jgi:hypothetical protein
MSARNSNCNDLTRPVLVRPALACGQHVLPNAQPYVLMGPEALADLAHYAASRYSIGYRV